MNRDDSVQTAIRQKDINTIISLLFYSDFQSIHPNYKTETELWDYKAKCPSISDSALEWAEISKDILAFHNTGKGGLIVFGVDDKDYGICGITSTNSLDSKLFNDKIRKYVGDKLWVEYYSISNKNGSITLGFVIIPPLFDHSSIKKFQKNGPDKHNKPLFLEGGSAVRKNDSSITLSPREAKEIELSRPSVFYREYDIDEPGYRLLSTDYHEFILRERYCHEIQKGLHHSRAASVCLIGIGGVGKTALATWAVKTAYKNNDYDYIVSISAKDRELTGHGIQSINQTLTSLDDLLDAILDVIGFPEQKNLPLNEKKEATLELISGEKLLLFVDNLETASSKEIIDFINNLPEPVKAIVTSRRNVITVSSYPIEIGPLEPSEIKQYISSLSSLDKFAYCRSLSDAEKEKIGSVYNGIPLAIKWVMSRCKTADELWVNAQNTEQESISNEELLEFSFRRVFDQMSSVEKSVMAVLSVISDLPIEAVIRGTGLLHRIDEVVDALETLVGDTLLIKYYDDEMGSDKYSLLSLTKSFMLNYCVKSKEENEIRRRMSSWYNATDIKDLEERQLVSAMRQNGTNMGTSLVQFAEAAAKKGDTETAIKFFNAAVARDAQNWKVYWRYGEYLRHVERSQAKAISMYESALKYSEKAKNCSEKFTMHREFGILYGSSGRADATKRAIEHFEIAHQNMPNDPICAKFLGEYLLKKGNATKAISVLKPFEKSIDKKARQNILPLLLKAYKMQPEKYMIEIAELEQRL